MYTFTLVTFVIILLLNLQIFSQGENKKNLSSKKLQLDRDSSIVIKNEHIEEGLKSKYLTLAPPKIVIKKELNNQMAYLNKLSRKRD